MESKAEAPRERSDMSEEERRDQERFFAGLSSILRFDGRKREEQGHF